MSCLIQGDKPQVIAIQVQNKRSQGYRDASDCPGPHGAPILHNNNSTAPKYVEADPTGEGTQEYDERVVVASTDAGSEPETVMVKVGHAVVTCVAVLAAS
jgi:hypothetical protein